jgi:hypothetical protein
MALCLTRFGPKDVVFLTLPVKKLYRTTLTMIESVPSPQSQSSTHSNQEYADEITINLDDALYRFHLSMILSLLNSNPQSHEARRICLSGQNEQCQVSMSILWCGTVGKALMKENAERLMNTMDSSLYRSFTCRRSRCLVWIEIAVMEPIRSNGKWFTESKELPDSHIAWIKPSGLIAQYSLFTSRGFR